MKRIHLCEESGEEKGGVGVARVATIRPSLAAAPRLGGKTATFLMNPFNGAADMKETTVIG